MLSGISAIKSIGHIGDTAGVGGAAATPGVGGASFSQVLAEITGDAVGTMKAGEATAISGITGNASTQQVVEAVMKAEQALQTAIAVRDKLVSAYQEISRMGI